MKKIKLFFERIENCFVFMDYLTCCLLLSLVIACAASGYWCYAVCNLVWLFIAYQNSILRGKVKRAREIIEAQQGLITAQYEFMDDLCAECTRDKKQPITRTTNISEAYKGMADSFSRAELKDYLEKQGIKSTVRKVIYKWKGKGLIKEVAKNIYIKTDISAG
jgi:hypothetical protein